ncbi:hypothetical protein PM10SUCC1_01060 [Propionigenium maris DSM 9537]|jgi:hypothetical protein|uniref:DUF4325 domain-containing protein n=1 Tax=Propionigenium maris DSM 9537 TaxID=1123000 RepID=A0A9W6GIX2_9FUSO|nr:DUF4325 domain-containing protein [Propionigenium maris]GLI54591.1 hypothetical protein PM10SUCC1_01060 [Propionigenium maris DSM 9537]
MEIIKMYNYEMVDLKAVVRKIDKELKNNNEVVLDFNGIAGVNFLELEEMFSHIFSNFAYERIKNRLNFRNVNPVVKFLIDDIVEQHRCRC